MVKRQRESKAQGLRERPVGPTRDWRRDAVLAGLLILILVAALGWAEMRRLRSDLTAGLGKLDTTMSQLSVKIVESAKQDSPPPRRGPDPNKVYAVKTAGAPSKGPPDAPITIAEFSDFQ